MKDMDFYKRKYADSWDQSASKEKRVARMITDGTRKMVAAVGFGAGSTDFITGTAASNGFEKNYPDLAIDGTPVLVEVTGPLTNHVDPSDPLWIRPGKLDFARGRLAVRTVWIVHHIVKGDLFRAIRLNRGFFEALDRGEFRTINPIVRGSRTQFVEIESNHSVVVSFERMITWLNNMYPYMEIWSKK